MSFINFFKRLLNRQGHPAHLPYIPTPPSQHFEANLINIQETQLPYVINTNNEAPAVTNLQSKSSCGVEICLQN